MKRQINVLITLVLLCFSLLVFTACKSQHSHHRFLIAQAVPWLTKDGNFKMEVLYDSVFVFDEKDLNGLRIVQLQREHSKVTDTTVIPLPTVLDYFIYRPPAKTGLYFEALNDYHYRRVNADSLMQYKIDKWLSVDTIQCLNGVPVKYPGANGDMIYSFAHTAKSNENYDYDSLKLIYTTDPGLQTEYLSKRMAVKEGKFLYKIRFYFKQTFDKKISETIPEREAEVRIIEDNNFNENELEQMIREYKKTEKAKD